MVILVLTGVPGKYIPGITSFWEWLGPDKIVHVLVFGILSFLLLYNKRQQYLQSRRRFNYIWVAILLTVFYGILTEVLQYYVFIGRSGNIYDGMADALGAFAGVLFFRWMVHKKIITGEQ